MPTDARNIALVLALGLFLGLEREQHKQQDTQHSLGGIRTFPLIGLVSYSLALMANPTLTPWIAGFVVIGVLMALSYYRKLTGASPAGVTTEVSALAMYVIGGLVHRELYWLATTMGVLSVLLLELRNGLEGLSKRFSPREITTVATFLVMTVVLLPIVPYRDLTPFHINPFKLWLVVVAVSGVSFASYVLQRIFDQRGGVILSALLGGAYSSTATTVVLAREAKNAGRPNLFAGSILAASGVMYARLVVLLAFFDLKLASRLAIPFAVLAFVAVTTGWLIARRREPVSATPAMPNIDRNPLEMRAALIFSLIFMLVLVLTSLVRQYLGTAGLYSLAAIMGVTDVDPFILGLASGDTAMPLFVAAAAITIATASNNLAKAIYAYSFADRETGRRSLALLVALALLGLSPLLFI